MNPRIGSGMQQAHEPSVEKAVEVVRDHEGGTCGSLAATCRRGQVRQLAGTREWTPVVMSMEGRIFGQP